MVTQIKEYTSAQAIAEALDKAIVRNQKRSGRIPAKTR